MIKKITIKDEASYQGDAEVIDGLGKFSFFYGANGSGKTTISRVIRNPHAYPKCTVDWVNGTPLQTLVYNKDFVADTFNQDDGIPGVFTLRDTDNETVKHIENLEKEKVRTSNQISNLSSQLKGVDGKSGKIGDLKKLDDDFIEACWEQKKKYDDDFKKVFKGFRDKKVSFANQVKANFNNQDVLKEHSELKDKYQSLYIDEPIEEQAIESIDTTEIKLLQTQSKLSHPVVGRKDVDIAALIDKLQASDWVRKGYQNYYNANDRICPFCQQKTSENLAKSLQDYFDDSYSQSIESIKSFLDQYETKTKEIVQTAIGIIDNNEKWIDANNLRLLIQKLETSVSNNILRINKKIKEPSTKENLDPIDVVIDDMNNLITQANKTIKSHNKTVANIKSERSDLKNQVWKFIVDDALDTTVKLYKRQKSGLDKAIENISNRITEAKENLDNINQKLRTLRAKITTTQKTIDDINSILESFGFNGFKLDKAADNDKYRIIRPDNPDAQSSLSEGEISFVTFLYFYFLIKGTQNAADTIDDRVIVFDDPVSSLDNDVLFAVSCLIRKIIREAKGGKSKTKQVIVLTHNAYFFRHLTYLPGKKDKTDKEILYWLVRKGDTGSRVVPHKVSPVKCTYQLMWDEYKHNEDNYHILPNTMRRILESYFTLLGGEEIHKLPDRFDGYDKLIYESLITWVNVDSHSIFEDANHSISEDNIDRYKSVFRSIFEKTGHIAHYNMMMGLENVSS
ncbi:MAG: AAA family ATPase [Bacteroidales bacterium]|nr:AAA family ATPase [Bacteroidales bacterium]